MSAIVAISDVGTVSIDTGQGLAALLRAARGGCGLVSDQEGSVIADAEALGVKCEPTGGDREYRCWLEPVGRW